MAFPDQNRGKQVLGVQRLVLRSSPVSDVFAAWDSPIGDAPLLPQARATIS